MYVRIVLCRRAISQHSNMIQGRHSMQGASRRQGHTSPPRLTPGGRYRYLKRQIAAAKLPYVIDPSLADLSVVLAYTRRGAFCILGVRLAEAIRALRACCELRAARAYVRNGEINVGECWLL